MDDSSFDKHISNMMEADLIAVDTETTGLNVIDGRDHLVGISCAYRLGNLGIVSAYFPFRHPDGNLSLDQLFLLRDTLERQTLVFHNLKFDLHSLRTAKIEPRGKLYDTMNMAHMINENWSSKGLDFLSRILLKEEKLKDELKDWTKMFGWENVPVDVMAPYAAKDAELTYKLFEVLWTMMEVQDLDAIWDTECEFTQVLRRIESRGIKTDLAHCQAEYDRGIERMGAIAHQLGFTPSRTSELSDYLFDELNLPILKWTPKDKPCMDKSVMAEYEIMLEAMDNEDAGLILAYRGWQKITSTLYKNVLAMTGPDGRVRPNFKQHGTVTGRLSCVEPNLQQIPRKGEKDWNQSSKKAFIPEDGYELWEFDYSQLEFRLAAAYGDETALMARFNEGEDPFLPTAIALFGGVEFRQDAKTFTYSTLYGAGVNRISTALKLSEGRATQARDDYRALYPGIYKASSNASKLCSQRGFVRYWTGRRRHLYKEDQHKAFNSVIQGGGAEIVKRALIRIDKEICNSDVKLVLTVHDSAVLEIRKELVEEIKPKVIQIMEDFPQFGVHFAVEAKLWGT